MKAPKIEEYDSVEHANNCDESESPAEMVSEQGEAANHQSVTKTVTCLGM